MITDPPLSYTVDMYNHVYSNYTESTWRASMTGNAGMSRMSALMRQEEQEGRLVVYYTLSTVEGCSYQRKRE